jgi:hypothetical protein
MIKGLFAQADAAPVGIGGRRKCVNSRHMHARVSISRRADLLKCPRPVAAKHFPANVYRPTFHAPMHFMAHEPKSQQAGARRSFIKARAGADGAVIILRCPQHFNEWRVSCGLCRHSM